jgi:hypothetical protein
VGDAEAFEFIEVAEGDDVHRGLLAAERNGFVALDFYRGETLGFPEFVEPGSRDCDRAFSRTVIIDADETFLNETGDDAGENLLATKWIAVARPNVMIYYTFTIAVLIFGIDDCVQCADFVSGKVHLRSPV